MKRLIYQSPSLPPMTDSWWNGLANQIVERLDAWQLARQPLEKQWEQNDQAYLCFNKLPYMESMPYIDNSDFGSQAVFNGVNALGQRLALAIMPKDDTWLTVVGRNGESPTLIKQIQAQQTWLHRKAQSRRKFSRHLKQLIIRGTSHLFLRWQTEYLNKRIGTTEGRRKLRAQMKKEGIDPALAKQIDVIKEPTVIFNGPDPRIVDSYDVFLDPDADILFDRRPAYILRLYMRPSELKKTENAETGEKTYKNLDGLVASRAGDVRMNDQDGSRRMRSNRILHVANEKTARELSAEVVPVYCYYSQYEEYDGEEFVDTYFYVAINEDGIPRMIRVEENPSYSGHHHLITDTYIDWFTSFAYGISGVEKVVSAYNQLNFLSAIQLNAMAASQFPALLVAGGYLMQDLLKVTPGAINEISQLAVGQEFITPVPTPERGVQLGFQDMQYKENQIGKTFDNFGAADQVSAPDRETATAAKLKAGSQGLSIDDSGEKFGDSLQTYCQWAYDENQATATPNENGEIEYAQLAGGQIVPGALKFTEWKQPRSIEILGIKGALQRELATVEKREGIAVLGQVAPMMPNAAAIIQPVVKSFFTDLQIETPEEAWMTPEQMLQANPAFLVESAVLALQNPETAIAVIEQLPPEIQAGLAKAFAQIHMQGPVPEGAQGGKPNAKPNPNVPGGGPKA